MQRDKMQSNLVEAKPELFLCDLKFEKKNKIMQSKPMNFTLINNIVKILNNL